VRLCDLAQAINAYDVRDPFTPALSRDQLCPYTREAYAALALGLARCIASERLGRRKVIAVDCDGTLWAGECGENGTLSVGPPHRVLQDALIRQWDAGTLLAILSRNNLIDVQRAFNSVNGMLLKAEHIANWAVNWHSKSQNLQALLEEFQLEGEAILFIDDDAFECAEVEKNCPEIPILHLPEDLAMREGLLKSCWLLDDVALTVEDRSRVTWKAVSEVRQRTLQDSLTLAEFLQHIDLRIEVRTASVDDCPRIAQLTQRTNQFNSTGV